MEERQLGMIKIDGEVRAKHTTNRDYRSYSDQLIGGHTNFLRIHESELYRLLKARDTALRERIARARTIGKLVKKLYDIDDAVDIALFHLEQDNGVDADGDEVSDEYLAAQVADMMTNP